MSALYDQQQPFLELIPQLAEALLVYQQDGKIIACNPQMTQLLGVRAEQLLEQTHLPCSCIWENGMEISPEDFPAHIVLQTKQLYANQLIGIYRADDQLIWTLVTAYPLNINHQEQCVICKFVDISTYIQREESLSTKLNFFTQLFENTTVGMAITDIQGQFVYLNTAFCDLFGYRFEELIHQPFTCLLAPELHTKAMQWHVRYLTNASSNSGNWPLQHRDKHLLRHHIAESQLMDEKGHLFKITTITNLQHYYQHNNLILPDLSHYTMWLPQLLRALSITLLSVDKRGILVFAQGDNLEILGIHADDLEQPLFKTDSPILRFSAQIKQALLGETLQETFQQNNRLFNLHFLPLMDLDFCVGLLLLLQDTTEQHRLSARVKTLTQETNLLITHAELGLLTTQGQYITRVNPRCESLFGYSQIELLSLSIQQLFVDSRDYDYINHLITEKNFDYQPRQWLRRKDETTFYAHIRLQPSQTQKTLWLVEDLTVKQQTQESLAIADIVWTNSDNAVFLLDSEHRILRANPAATHFTGYFEAELTERFLQDLQVEWLDNHINEAITSALQHNRHWQGMVWQRHKRGGIYQCHLTVQPYQPASLPERRYIVILNQLHNQRSALHDPLTQLANRALFCHNLNKTLTSAKRNHKTFALLLINIDNMADINQQFGYVLGDKFLQRLGTSFEEILRHSDLVARYDGAQFIIALGEISEPQHAGLVGEMLLFKATQPLNLEDCLLQSKASIGIVVYPQDQGEVNELLTMVELATQQAQQLGGDQCLFYNLALQALHKS
ncbi:PAS domain S-box/diguanylate cyclase (GGDEF) domain-containing protein [Beggiatoa alba B18LD]|uniref:PAS domain S-box/diguanylate cyclase (GGDEF) domain-containing protein n=2 Tax=Beggiatoa alba TaxID=1022 RepID=I3CGJ6_9GAMM|nr:PAS domain S-box/diguanylate cyclase (GGDEF) domain-containing protein [Beggiatoa alba B18LD]